MSHALVAQLEPVEALAVAASVVALVIGVSGFRDRRAKVYREERDVERSRADKLADRVAKLEGELRARPDLAGVVKAVSDTVRAVAEQSGEQWRAHEDRSDGRALRFVEALQAHDDRAAAAAERLAMTLEIQTEILRKLADAWDLRLSNGHTEGR